MLQIIYWILAILVMALLLVNAIKSFQTDKEYRCYIKKQEALLDRQAKDMFLKDLKEFAEMLEALKNESEVK